MSQQRKNDHGYFDFASLIEPYGINRIGDSFFDMVTRSEAVIQLFHPDEYEANKKVAAAVAVSQKEEIPKKQENEEDEAKQTRSNQHAIKKKRMRQSRGTARLSVDIWKLDPELTPNYDEIQKQKFKKLLCQANPSYHQQLQRHLSNQKLLSFIQKYACLMSKRVQLEMEKDYWIHVIDGLLFAVKWLSQMPKNFTKQYSMNWDYPRTEHNIRHRQKLVENKLKKIHQEIQNHLQKYPSYQIISNETSMDQTMHMISDALKVMIQNDLQKLHKRFEEKKNLIQNDVYDIQLLKLFNDLFPTEDQKTKARMIWRGKRNYCERRIRQMKTNLINDKHENMNRDHQPYQIPFLESFDHTMRTIIETRRANIENRTEKIISFLDASSSLQP